MTRKEIEKAYNILYKKYYWDNPHTNKYLLKKWTKKDKTTENELNCREMLNSCLLYSGWDIVHSQYLKSYILELWEEKVQKLYEEQLKDFKEAKTCKVWEDSEWWTYFSIHRKDED